MRAARDPKHSGECEPHRDEKTTVAPLRGQFGLNFIEVVMEKSPGLLLVEEPRDITAKETPKDHSTNRTVRAAAGIGVDTLQKLGVGSKYAVIVKQLVKVS